MYFAMYFNFANKMKSMKIFFITKENAKTLTFRDSANNSAVKTTLPINLCLI